MLFFEDGWLKIAVVLFSSIFFYNKSNNTFSYDFSVK